MNSWSVIYLLVFAGGTVSTLLLTPLFRHLAGRMGFMDMPADNHKGHRKATPLLGGMALFCGWCGSLAAGAFAVYFGLVPEFSSTMMQHLTGFQHASLELIFIMIGALVAVALGLWDDRYAMSAAAKFSGQFAVALIAVLLGGVRIKVFGAMPPVLSIAVTVFWIMLLMNAINFFDNMDGLAVGTIAVAMGFFTVIAALNAQYFVAAFSALSCGVCCGFWFYNAAPASIFMGDSGSHFLGYLAAVVSAGISFFDRSYSLSRFPVLIPFFILALPLFDTAMVVLIRTKNGKPFWIGDHNHISHRFVRMGLSRPQAVMLVHLLALCIGLGIVPVFWGDFRTAAILVVQSLLILGIITVMQFSLSGKSDTRETPPAPDDAAAKQPEPPLDRHR